MHVLNQVLWAIEKKRPRQGEALQPVRSQFCKSYKFAVSHQITMCLGIFRH